ncbi:hypothetical protein D9619_003028 [Psilocybe cf. subviscida]|uniref:SCP domain-containing protein n=1 Tax=Psilocybe cf. subviscida TaxID=2480587 RepID=A0A8H5AXV2_9AGAR|nr:hypothetical protein D9619_003028 [Psilocybe cf. subviscida]
MARLAAILTLSVLFASLPSALAGPACARRHFKQADCVARCKSRWGWTGAMMNTDPWGSVVQKTDTDANWDAAIASACGSPSVPASAAVPSVTPPTANAISAPSGDDNTVTASASATASIASSSPLPASIANFFSSASAARASVTLSKALPSGTPSARVQIASTIAKPASSPSAAGLRPTDIPVTTARAARPSPVAPITTSPKPVEPTPTKAATTAANSGSNNGGSSGTSQADIQAYLAGHNTIRAQHGASALTWNDNLASKAQEWANKCVFQHSGGQLGPFGENLAAGTGSSYGIAAAIKSWTDEVSEYNPSNPVASHFTQVVWKGTSEVGCAVASCNGIFDPKFGPAKFFVCEYSKQGNIIGQFPQNVQV